MAQFTLNFTEVQRGFIEVKADSKEEAEEMALDLYNDGKVIWTHSSITEIAAEMQEGGYMCCRHETPRNLDWCGNNCERYYSCDTAATALDDEKKE